MFTKDLFSKENFIYNKTLENKILSQNIYGKFFVRSNVLNNDNFHLLENNSNFTIFSNRETKMNFPRNFNLDSLIGNSFLLKATVFKNQRNNLLQIPLFSSNLQPLIPHYTEEFLNSVRSQRATTVPRMKSLIVLKPIKGGFKCYSSGVFGFLPKSHGLRLFVRAFFSGLRDKTINNVVPNLNFFFNKTHFIKKYFLMRLPGFHIKMRISPLATKNNFSLSSRRKKRIFRGRLNCVFLHYKKKKINLDEKIKKIINRKNNKKTPV